MTETYSTIGEWAVRTFGAGKPLACYAKLAEEFGEIARPLQKREYEKALYEMADVVIVLSHMATSLGLELQRAVDEKMSVNRARTWSMTPEGTAIHVNPKPAVPETKLVSETNSTLGST